MATKVWKRLRRVEKAGLIALCAVMLLTLGIGGSTVFGSCDKSVKAGSITIDGKRIEIDQVEYNQFLRRHHALLRVSSMANRQTPRIETSQLEQQFLLFELARRAGIRVSDDSLRRLIQEHPRFADPTTRQFDRGRYRQLLETAKTSEHEFEQALRELLEIRGYMDLFESALGPTREGIYATFKARNKKYVVEYTWRPLDPFREQVDPATFTEEELTAYYETIKNDYPVETRRQIEAAYVVLVDVPAEKLTELYGKFPDCQVSYTDGYMYFRRRTDDFGFRAYEKIRAKREGEAEKADGGKETGKAGEESGRTGVEGPVKPPGESTPPAVPPGGEEDRRQVAEDVPAADPPAPAPPPDRVTPEGEAPPGGVEPGETGTPAEPAKPAEPTEADRYDTLREQERYETYWADVIRKELFFQRLAQKLLVEAKETPAPLEDLAKKYGLLYTKSELLAPTGMQSIPGIGCEDLRLETNKYDKRFEGNLIPRVLPTTNTSTEPLRRGWQVARIVKVDPEHVSPYADVEAKVRERYLQKKIYEAAEAEMKKLLDAASAAGADFAAILAEQGLPLRKLPGFNAFSPRPFVDDMALKGTDPEAKAKAREAALDDFVMTRGLSDIRRGDVAWSNPLFDDGDGSAVVLVHVLGKEDPGPEEMSRRDERDIRRQQLQMEEAQLGTGPFSLESLSERLAFVRPGHGRGE